MTLLVTLLLSGCVSTTAPPSDVSAPEPSAAVPAEAPAALPDEAAAEGAPSAAAVEEPPAQAPPGTAGSPSRFGPFRETLAFTACRSGCFEPVVAADPAGRVFVTTGEGGLMVAEDGGLTFAPRDPPPAPPELPPGVGESRAAGNVQVSPEGRLYWSALVVDARGATARLLGAQVAASDDGGATWASNAFVPLLAQHATLAPGNDRPWLAFGPQGTVYLSYEAVLLSAGPAKQALALDGGVWVGRSDDGGVTFGPFRRVFDGAFSGAVAGMGVVDEAGRLYLPAFDLGGAPTAPPADPLGLAPAEKAALRVAVSDDGGETFRKTEVTTEPGGFFPSLVAAPDGRLHLAWWDARGQVMLSSSSDFGVTWSAPERISRSTENATASPWLLAHDGLLDAAWLSVTDDGKAALTLARRPLDGSAPFERAVVVPRIDGHPGKEGNTDFAQAAPLLSGGVALVWSDRSLRETRVAIET